MHLCLDSTSGAPRGDVWKGTARGTRRGERRRRRRDLNPIFFNRISRTKLRYHLLANNPKTRSNTRHEFYVENPCGNKPQASIGDLHYDERVTTQEYNELSCSSVRLTRCMTKLTGVKYENKSAKYITRTVGPPGVPTRHTLRIRIILTSFPTLSSTPRPLPTVAGSSFHPSPPFLCPAPPCLPLLEAPFPD
jgi:hypothetical protein